MENCAQGPDFERVVSGNCDAVFRPLYRRAKTNVAASLPRDFVTIATQQTSQILSAEVARQLQAEITSSLTRWRRITEGLLSASK